MGRKALIFWGGWDGHTPDRSAAIVSEMLSANDFSVDVHAGTAILASAMASPPSTDARVAGRRTCCSAVPCTASNLTSRPNASRRASPRLEATSVVPCERPHIYVSCSGPGSISSSGITACPRTTRATT